MFLILFKLLSCLSSKIIAFLTAILALSSNSLFVESALYAVSASSAFLYAAIKSVVTLIKSFNDLLISLYLLLTFDLLFSLYILLILTDEFVKIFNSSDISSRDFSLLSRRSRQYSLLI